MTTRREKREVLDLLRSGDLNTVRRGLRRLDPHRVIHPVIGAFCHSDEMVRWLAVTAMGILMVPIADQEMEDARVIMRRLMWSLNDESGGIGWGAPEAMAEIMACHAGLAAEYGHMLVSYLREDGNFLEHEILQRGLLWGVSRLAEARPVLLLDCRAALYLPGYLDSPDATVRGLAARALLLLTGTKHSAAIDPLREDHQPVRYYRNGQLHDTTVAGLAGDTDF